MATNDRTRFSDDRLDDRFKAIDSDLDSMRGLPAQVSALAAQVGALASTVGANQLMINERLDRMRADEAEHVAVLREDTRQVNRVVIGFLSSLLVAMVGCIIAVIIVL